MREVTAIQRILPTGEHRRILEWTVAEAAPALVKTGVITAEDLDRALLEMQRADENIVVFMPRMLQVVASL